jgi:hypothetical protein
MFVMRKLTLTIQVLTVLSLSAGLTSCSLIPFPQSWNASDDEAAPQQKATAQLPKILPKPKTSNDKVPIELPQKSITAQPAPSRLSTAEIEKLALQARNTKTKLPANAQEDDLEDEALLASKSTAKGKNAAQIAAQNLIKGRKNPTKTGRSNEDETNFIPNAPKTYRLDGPQQMANNMPPEAYQQQAYNQQNYYSPNQGSYPRNPAQFQSPQTMAQGNMLQGGFMPPDPAPIAPKNDPRAVMEAVERMRAKQAVQPNPQMDQPTGTIAAQTTNQADPQPKTPLTFVQFERGSTTLNPSGQKSLSSMIAPHARAKKAKIYLTAGLGGEGEAYTKLLQANQRAQAISERIPSQFEVIRRFDPALPNESVRLFVVE